MMNKSELESKINELKIKKIMFCVKMFKIYIIY